MGNVLRILARDLMRLLKAPAALIVAGALLVLPSLYTWYNVEAFWDPYNSSGNMHVCVINQDEGAETEATGALNVGETVLEELLQNDRLDWMTEDYDQAMEDLKVGNVYAVYVIPEDFSECLVSPLTGEAKSPHIQYFANEKLGPVSPKITDAAANTLDQTINSMFVKTVSDKAVETVNEAVETAEADIDETKSQAETRADSARAAIEEVHRTLASVQDAIADAQGKVSQATTALDDANTLTTDAQTVLQDVSDEALEIQSSLADVSSSSIPSLSGATSNLSKLTGNASKAADRLASATSMAQTNASLALDQAKTVTSGLLDAAEDLQTAASAVTSDTKLKSGLEKAAQDANGRATKLQNILDEISDLNGRVASTSSNVASIAKSVDAAANRATDSFQTYANGLFNLAAPAVSGVVAKVGAACTRLSLAVSNLNASVQQTRPVLRQLNSILLDCGTAVSQTDTLIADIQGDVDSVVSDARLLVESDRITDLVKNGTLNARNISEFMGAPTELTTTKLYHPNAYGSAMAPLFMNLTFWIGAFMLIIIFHLEVDSEGIEGLRPWQRYLGRFLLFAIFSVLQAVICCAGTLALGVEAADVVAFFAASVVTALAFLSLIYALSATFRHIGQALCIVLVFAQIPGGSGLYPVELTSSFFQAIYPLLPFSYGIDALREALGGFYGNYFVRDLAMLGVFFVGSLLLGIALGPLTSNVVRLTARQIHDGDLYNGGDEKAPVRPYRVTQVLRALSEKDQYRRELEERYARFSRLYPVCIRTAIALGLGVPVALAVLGALDAAEKVTLLTILLIWLVALICFLVVVESLRYSFERQLDLRSMNDESLIRLYARRNHMLREDIVALHRHRELHERDPEAGPVVEAARADEPDGESARAGEPEGEPVGEAASEFASGSGSEGETESSPDEESEPAPKKKPGIHNVWLIARRDARGLFKNVMSVVLTVGLVVLPSLFAWYNVLACWDVFDNTGNLSVAVASLDEGYESDLVPVNVNVGDEVISALRANSQINWVFTDADDALEGTKAGKYYAALVIPKDFSKQMLTFYEGDSASAKIDYYVNEKKNAIAPNITNTGADTVSYEVNATFAKTVSEIAISLVKSLSEYAQNSNADAHLTALAEHMRTVASRIDQSADILGLYSSLAEDSEGLVQDSANLLSSAHLQTQTAISGIEADKQRLHELAASLSSAVKTLTDSLESVRSAADDLSSKARELIADAASDAPDLAGKLRKRAEAIDEKASDVAEVISTLKELRKALKSGTDSERKALISGDKFEVELTREIEIKYQNTLLLDKDIAALSKAADILRKASNACSKAADDLESGRIEAESAIGTLEDTIDQVRDSLDNLGSDLADSLKPNTEKLNADIDTLTADLDRTAERIGAAGAELPNALNSVATGLGNASGKIDGAGAKLRSAANSMRDLADAVNEALASGNTDKLRSLLQGNAGDLAAALSTPVQIERTALFPSENFGSAMAPLYCTLGLFVGALLIMVAMSPEVSRRGREQLHDPKPRHLYFGRFCAVAIVSLLQTTLLGLGNMFFLKVQVANPLLFMLAFWIAGLVFAFIVYTLVVAFGNLGKAIAVLLLIVQVTACGGSYPLPLLPDFVQAISPWVPATYVVNALRAAMMGVYQNDFWIAIGQLLLFVIPFLLLGLVLRKPLDRFMRFYVRKVEESGIMG